MYGLIVELDVLPAQASELEVLLTSLVDAARDEVGTVYYAAHRFNEDAGRFVLYELYRDQAAWDEHMRHEPTQRYLQRFDALLSAPPKVQACEMFAAKAFSGVSATPET